MQYLYNVTHVDGQFTYSLTNNSSDALYFECEIFARKMIDYMIEKHVYDNIDESNKPIYKFGVITKHVDDKDMAGKPMFNHACAIRWGLSP